jgi:hypothetical protein
MSFFERPARPTAGVFRAMAVSPPAWLGPPHDVLPGIAPVQLIIARTSETVVAIAGIQAYPAGFGFTLSLRLRSLFAREEQQFPYLLDRAVFEAEPLPMSSCGSVWSLPTVAKPPTSTASLRPGGPSAGSTGAEPARRGRQRLDLGHGAVGVATATDRTVRLCL